MGFTVKTKRQATGKRGASALTYGLLVGLIAVAALVTLQGIGGNVVSLFDRTASVMSDAGTGGAAGEQEANTAPSAGGCAGFSTPSGWTEVYLSGTGSGDSASCGAVDAPCNLVAADTIARSPSGAQTVFVAMDRVSNPNSPTAFEFGMTQQDQALCSLSGAGQQRIEAGIRADGSALTFAEIEIGGAEGDSRLPGVFSTNATLTHGDVTLSGVDLIINDNYGIQFQGSVNLLVENSSISRSPASGASLGRAIFLQQGGSSTQAPHATVDINSVDMTGVQISFVDFQGRTPNSSVTGIYKLRVRGTNNWAAGSGANTAYGIYADFNTSHVMQGEVDIIIEPGLTMTADQISNRMTHGIFLHPRDNVVMRAKIEGADLNLFARHQQSKGIDIFAFDSATAHATVDGVTVTTSGNTANGNTDILKGVNVRHGNGTEESCMNVVNSTIDFTSAENGSSIRGIEVTRSTSGSNRIEVVAPGASASANEAAMQSYYETSRNNTYINFTNPQITNSNEVYMGNPNTIQQRNAECDQPSFN